MILTDDPDGLLALLPDAMLDVEDFVAAMKHSLGKQIEAFGNFVVANPRLRAAIKAKDWTTFARIYNGPGYAENQYDLKMKQNYELLSKRL